MLVVCCTEECVLVACCTEECVCWWRVALRSVCDGGVLHCSETRHQHNPSSGTQITISTASGTSQPFLLPVARRRDLYLTTHNTQQQTDIHAAGGIRTHNLSMRAAADPRLRPLGHWDWPGIKLLAIILKYLVQHHARAANGCACPGVEVTVRWSRQFCQVASVPHK